MFITFFCKRDKHLDCPRKWPINKICGPSEDCSFDVEMIDCDCECHHHLNDGETIQKT